MEKRNIFVEQGNEQISMRLACGAGTCCSYVIHGTVGP